MKNHQRLNPRSHVLEYQARTLRPITAYPLSGDGKSRVIPGGALVTIHENTTRAVITATAYMGGDPYEATVNLDQFTKYNQ